MNFKQYVLSFPFKYIGSSSKHTDHFMNYTAITSITNLYVTDNKITKKLYSIFFCVPLWHVHTNRNDTLKSYLFIQHFCKYISEIYNDCLSITEKLKDTNQRPSDCTYLELTKGNGMYKIYPKHLNLGFYVYCDLETDNVNGWWTVIRFINHIIKLTRNIYVVKWWWWVGSIDTVGIITVISGQKDINFISI